MTIITATIIGVAIGIIAGSIIGFFMFRPIHKAIVEIEHTRDKWEPELKRCEKDIEELEAGMKELMYSY